MMRKVFLLIDGQYENLGDVYHRRGLIKCLGREDYIVLAGRSVPSYFLDAVFQNQRKTVVNNKFTFLLKFIQQSILYNRPIFVFHSGEVSPRWRRICIELGLLPFLNFGRLMGGEVFRIGNGLNRQITESKIKLFCWRIILAYSDFKAFRTKENQQRIRGSVYFPDLIFQLTDDLPTRNKEKGKLKISIGFRFDTSLDWVEFINSFRHCIASANVEIQLISNVKMDFTKTLSVAKTTGITMIGVDQKDGYGTAMSDIENALSNSDLIISDRLHLVLIGAAIGVPVCGIENGRGKLSEHLNCYGLPCLGTHAFFETIDKFGLASLLKSEPPKRIRAKMSRMSKDLMCRLTEDLA